MKKAIVRLYFPSDAFGKLICWRLESEYSHATIEFDGTIYSATFPKVVAVSTDNKDFGMPPREGRAFEITLTDEQAEQAESWFKEQVGTDYDFVSMLGWALRMSSLQSRKHVYCFESVYACLAAAGVFPVSKMLVTGDQLLVDLYKEPTLRTHELGGKFGIVFSIQDARAQKKPLIVPTKDA